MRGCVGKLAGAGLRPKVMIDASHGNSQKQHERQLVVVEDIARQLESGDTSASIMGVMLESNLVEGKSASVSGERLLIFCVQGDRTFPPRGRRTWCTGSP